MSAAMNPASRKTQRVYLGLTLSSTLATSFIWGINTLFLLSAGLSNAEAFAANAFYTVGTMLFEVPTGVVADAWGRKASYVLGTVTLLVSTALYLLMWETGAPFLGWAASSMVLGLGFTFFSGATEAWLVDALAANGYRGDLEQVFARGQIVNGVAMLTGSVAGGYIAQVTSLGVPYLMRAGMLFVTFVLALVFMKDIGFSPDRSTTVGKQIGRIVRASVTNGLRNRPVRWIMLMSPFTMGVAFYAFYAMQPYLLELYGDPDAYGIAGLAAAVIAGAQVVGGVLAVQIRRLFRRRTHAILLSAVLGVMMLAAIGLTDSFWVAVATLVVWAMSFAAVSPIRQAFINGLIPSSQRATVLSFDSLLASTGSVAAQPGLGRVADVSGYSASYLITAAIQVAAIPFAVLARRENASSDEIVREPDL